MATLDEIRLQQLLAPFSTGNQTGILNSTNALPMINNNPFINVTDQLMKFDPNIQNKSIVDQIIAKNQMKANQFDPTNFRSIFPTNVQTGIRQQVPLQNLGIDTSYGVANEPDEEQVEYLTEQEPSGIAKLFEFLRNLPSPFNLARKGIAALADRAGQFFQNRRDRESIAARNMAQARGITKSLASKPSSTSGGYQQGPGGSGAQSTGASKSQSQAGPGFSGSGSAAEMGSF